MLQHILKLEGGVDVNVTAKLGDLREFAEYLIDMGRQERTAELEALNSERLLTRQEVMDLFHVGETTLWNWNKDGKLVQKKVGNNVFYLESEVQRVLGTRKRISNRHQS